MIGLFKYWLYILSTSIITRGHDSSSTKAQTAAVSPKVLGGIPVQIQSFPHMAQFHNSGSMCAATVLASKLLLSAAHCFHHSTDLDEMHVVLGARYILEPGSQIHSVWDFIVHEEFNRTMLFQCDIALIYLENTITFGPKVQKAVLADTYSWMNEDKQAFDVVGWGRTQYNETVSEKGLLKAQLRYISQSHCMKLHELYFTPDMFCLYGEGERDACRGDSGGGIMWNGLLVGVVSHGDGCGKRDRPSLYVNVVLFREWIRNKWAALRSKHCSESSQGSAD